MGKSTGNELTGLLMVLGVVFVALMALGFIVQFWPLILIGLGLMVVIGLCGK